MNRDHHELESLVLKAQESTLSEEQRRSLNEMLQNSENQKAYFEIIKLTCALKHLDSPSYPNLIAPEPEDTFDLSLWQQLAYEEIIRPKVESAKKPAQLIERIERKKIEHKVTRGSISVIAASVAIIFCFVLFVMFAPPKGGSEVATVTDIMDTQLSALENSWNKHALPLPQGSRLETGKTMVLDKGYIEVAFDNQVKATFEGPAEFDIVTDDQINLRMGRVYVRVPQGAIGFTVDTQTARIIDLGTEFGVDASSEGDVSLHVIKGKTTLIAGRDSSRESMQVTANAAKRVSSSSNTISDIPLNNRLFVRQINSSSNMAWRGQDIDLADIVGGGNGFGSGKFNSGVDVATGKFISRLKNGEIQTGSPAFMAVDASAYIDSVFVPGAADGPSRINSLAGTVQFPRTSGVYWGYIANGAFHEAPNVHRHNLELNGTVFGTSENPAITVHSNQGITFDLDEIRKCVPEGKITKFSSLAGLSETIQPLSSSAVFWVFLDGQKVFEQKLSNTDKPVQLDIPILQSHRFLTLAVTEADDEWANDWALFGRPKLQIEMH